MYVCVCFCMGGVNMCVCLSVYVCAYIRVFLFDLIFNVFYLITILLINLITFNILI